MKKIIVGLCAACVMGCLSFGESNPWIRVKDLKEFSSGLDAIGRLVTEKTAKVEAKIRLFQQEYLYIEGYENGIVWYASHIEGDIGHNPEYEYFRYRVDFSKTYVLYLTNREGYVYVTRVDGELKSIEEGAEAVAAIQAKEKADATAKVEAEAKASAEKAKREAEKEAKQNPKKLNRSQYKQMSAEEFSFDMVAGKLAAGTKAVFTANFLLKPTGTSYTFKNINALISFSTDHNFVKDLPESRFTGILWGNYVPQLTTVKVYVTIKKPGQTGECSVDIIDWD